MLHGSVVRISQLFGEELDLMVQFCVSHITAAPETESVVLCNYLFREIISNETKADNTRQECFTMMERLSILKKLNKRLI